MLSYQHAYHAGCFADVIKHLTLSSILDYMVQKEKPLFYLDTHSGRGRYDLKDKFALKTQEAAAGIETLWSHRHRLPSEFASYLAAIAACNPDQQLRFYPGSPAIATLALRPQDRLFFSELHPEEFEHLQAFTRQHPRAHCANDDGYQQLSALLPPPERRGLIMIDPSYEIKTEYRDLPNAIQSAYNRFETGIYCVWYPLLDNKTHGQLMRGFDALKIPKQLRVEFQLNPKTQQGMHGCGLWIINPPFLLKSQLTIILDSLLKIFNPGRSSYYIQ